MKNIDINEIINYINEGLIFEDISKKLNCSASTIQRILKKNNVIIRKKDIDKEQLIKMYKKLTPIKDIAKYFCCSVNTIRLKIKEYDIELNTKKVYFLPEIGQKFNKLSFIKEVDKKNNKRQWLCECECGNIKVYDYYTILSGSVKSCGCYHKEHVKDYNWTGLGVMPGIYWNSLKRGAINRNIEFDITLDYLLNLYNEQNGLCKLSNLKITFNKVKKNDTFDASLDRIDSNKGYVEGNVQWIVKEINYMKNKINENMFIDLCKKINKYSD